MSELASGLDGLREWPPGEGPPWSLVGTGRFLGGGGSHALIGELLVSSFYSEENPKDMKNDRGF